MIGKKKDKKKLIIGIAILGGLLFTAKATMRTVRSGKGHWGDRDRHSLTNREEVYEQVVKPCIDHVLSFLGLIILSPLFGLISLAIYFDDPGPVFFTQKRVGKDKTFFELHKFRSMKMSTPHDVPTHQLQNPEQYITKVGAFLRKTSLDELPQIWDIFRGKMSIIGPRPALWNQEDLIAEREKYGANDVKPGLTGWAQINGRDELEIPDKAKMDGEYVEHLRQGGWRALFFDGKCFVGTILSVIGRQGVVEGGTGEIRKKSFSGCSVKEMYESADLPLRSSARTKHAPIKILIVGANSYIGTSFEQYLKGYNIYKINTLDTLDLNPQPSMFEGYDVVFHVAGIAHRKETKEIEHLYYEVNRDLAVKVAEAARRARVAHFIILSSMSVYGMETGYITRNTKTNPKTYYGKSKLQADEIIWSMRDEKFHVAILRPPMVYGKDCKGNYQLLKKLTLKVPVFPNVNNERSMIYIGNLCKFVKDVIDGQREGIFFPQNKEYVNTSRLVEQIAAKNSKKIRYTTFFNPVLKVIPMKLIDKVFGDLTYERTDTVDEFSFEESIEESESKRAMRNSGLNIWIFHHYATTPDRNGYIRPFRFAKHLEKDEIRTVIFASSYHHWADMNVISDGSAYKIENSDGVPYVFVNTPSSAAGSIARVKNMVAFAAGLLKIARSVDTKFGKPDMILASSPHPLTMISGIRVAKKYGIPCICEIRDLWPDAIFAGGKLKERSMIGKALIAGEHWIYRNANALIFTKEGDTDYLYEKRWMTSQGGDINPAKCFYINNGVELSLYDEQIKTEILDDEDLKDNSFKVVYAGAIRPVNDVRNIVDAAKLLPKDSGIKILIYGDGNLRKELEKRVENEKLENVKFKGYVNQKYIPYILSKSSVNLLNYSSSNYTWSRGSSSNKLFEYLASGKPVIATVKTGYSIIQRYDCGLEMEKESPKELAKDVLQIKAMDQKRYAELCTNARKAAYDFDYEKLTERLLKVIQWVKN